MVEPAEPGELVTGEDTTHTGFRVQAGGAAC